MPARPRRSRRITALRGAKSSRLLLKSDLFSASQPSEESGSLRWRLYASGGGDASLIEETPEDHGAAWREVTLTVASRLTGTPHSRGVDHTTGDLRDRWHPRVLTETFTLKRDREG